MRLQNLKEEGARTHTVYKGISISSSVMHRQKGDIECRNVFTILDAAAAVRVHGWKKS